MLATCAALAGCASGTPFQKIAEVPAGKALIYIYRPATMHGAALVPYVVVDDSSATALKSGSYYPFYAKPGDVTVSITHTGQRSVKLHVDAGRTYYVRGGLVFMAFGIPYIEEVSEQTAMPEITECKRIADAGVTSHSAAKGEVSVSSTASQIAPSASVSASSEKVPYLTESRQPKFQEYLRDPSPKAFAISKNGHYGKAYGTRPRDVRMSSDPKERALALCNSVAGQACILYAVDSDIVFKE